MTALDRLATGHRYALNAVQRAVAGSHAYGMEAPNLLARLRIYLSVLRQRLSERGY